MIDAQRDTLLTMPEAAALARGYTPAGSVTPKTVTRWAKTGLRGIRLETTKTGRRRCTTADAVGLFFARLTALDAPPPEEPRRTPRRLDARERLRTLHNLEF